MSETDTAINLEAGVGKNRDEVLAGTRVLGVDFGTKRIGLAISDPEKNFAMPLMVLENNAKAIDALMKIIQEKNIERVVFGQSNNFAGQENPVMLKARDFTDRLGAGLDKNFHKKIAIFWQPEFMTTIEASHIQGQHDKIDASAAALILRYYLQNLQKDPQKNS